MNNPTVSEEESTIDTGWNNPPTLMSLKQDLEDAKRPHETQKTKVKRWLDNLNVEGQAKPVVPKGHSAVQPKLIRKQAEWRYAALSEPFLATDELFKLSPVTWEDTEASRQNSLVINNQLTTKIDKVAFIDQFVRAAVDEGTAIVKLGWEYEEEEVVKEVADEVVYTPNPGMEQLHAELLLMRTENPTGYENDVPEELKLAHEFSLEARAPHEAEIVSTKMETSVRVIKNNPSLEICDYRNVIPDPTCNGDLDKAAFVIHSFETTKTALQKSPINYQNLDQIIVNNSSPLSEPDHETDHEEELTTRDEPRRPLVAYEYWGYWDINGNGLVEPIVATWVGNTLIRLEENPFPDRGLPFVFVPLLPVKRSIYGEPDGELLEDNQKIIGAITRGMLDLMGRSANGQMGTMKGALDAVNRRKFQQGKDYEFNQNVDPSRGFYMHQYPEIPQSAQFMIELQNFEAESMSGVKAFNHGINADSLGSVATGIRSAIDSAAQRELGILRRLSAGMIKVGRKIIAMNQEFLEDEEIIRITNENFVNIRREDLGGNFDVFMDISTNEEDNIKAQELAFMLQTMGNNLDPGMSKLILRDIARLRKMPELAKQIEDYEPQPDPLAQQIQMLEAEKLKAEIAKLYSEVEENQAEARESDASARNKDADTDQKNLDFVEQESGTKHERDVDLQQAQAEGNIQLERVKQAGQTQEGNVTELESYLSEKNTG